MKVETKRTLLFIFGCLGARSALTYFAYSFENTPIIKIVSLFTFAISVGFITIYAFGLRKTGPEVFGDKIWWNDLRPIHALFYFLFSVYAILGKKHAWIWLFIDTLLGASAFAFHKLV